MTATRLLTFLAGLTGAAGVVLAALGAHSQAGTTMPAAATMLSLHAPAILALAIGRKAGLLHDLAARIAAWGLFIGAALFAGAIAMPLLAGIRLFPMAAPTGGTILIAAWLVAAAAGLAGGQR